MTEQTQTAETKPAAPAQPAQPQAKPPALVVGGQVSALVPQNIEDAFRVASAFHRSGLAPSSFKTPEAILVSIMAGAELGFAPYQSMVSFAVINGRAAIWGDAIPALLWSNGFDLEEWWEGEGDAMVAHVTVTRPSGKEITRTFSVDDARKASLWGKAGPWQTNPKRMLQMRARAFAARDGAADVLRGLPVYEEVADYQDVTPRGAQGRPSGLRERLEASAPTGEGFSTAQAQHIEPTHVSENADAVDAVVEDILEEANVEEGATDAEFEETKAADDEPGEEPSGATQDPEPTEDEINAQEAAADAKRAADDFPGDRPAGQPEPQNDPTPTEQATPAAPASLKARVAACRTRLSDIGKPNVTKLNATWKNAKPLRDDLDAADPDAYVELVAFYEELLAQHEDAAREAAKQ